MLAVPQLQQTHMLKAGWRFGWEGVWVLESEVSDGWSWRLFGLAFRIFCQLDGALEKRRCWIPRLLVGLYAIRMLRARAG